MFDSNIRIKVTSLIIIDTCSRDYYRLHDYPVIEVRWGRLLWITSIVLWQRSSGSSHNPIVKFIVGQLLRNFCLQITSIILGQN